MISLHARRPLSGGYDAAVGRRIPSQHRVGLDPRKFATHSAADEGDLDLPPHGEFAGGAGHIRIESTIRYLGVEVDDTLEIAEKIDVY